MAGRCPVGQLPTFGASNELSARPFSGWQATIGYRWLKSDRHFTGTREDPERQEENSEVINEMNTVDVGISYAFSPRFSLSLSVPFVANDRNTRIAFQGESIGRSHVHANGFGDIRLMANYWLWDPAGHTEPAPAESYSGKGPAPPAPARKGRRGNVRLSVGIDAPTGREDARDYRQIRDPATGLVVYDYSQKRIVDQSIQPGDGGWGIPIDLYAYYNLNDRLSAYFQGSYLITPEEKNGVPTGRGNINDPNNNFESIMSIGDTWMARGGFEYALLPQHGLNVSLGLRSEGQPVHDLIGGSDGFRRPGMNIAVEPGISWMKNGWSASLTVPIVFYRERFQSVPDKQRTEATGIRRHGDAAFADVYVMFSVGRQF